MRAYRAAGAVVLLVLAAFWLARPATGHEAAPPLTVSPARATPRVPKLTPAGPTPSPTVELAAVRAAQKAAQARTRALTMLHQSLWLHAVGAQLYTAWGTPVTLKTINWYGFEYAPFVPGGLDHVPLDHILSSVRALGFNAVRIMFADQTVEANPVVTRGLGANPELRGLHALDIMQRVLERAHHFGLRVILCNSRSEAGRGPEIKTGLWYTRQYPESAWFADWETLARRFRQDSAFVGADLRNEPHITGGVFNEQTYVSKGPMWGAYNGVYYHDRDWHYAAQTLGNDLLAINPHLMIIVEGVQLYADQFRHIVTGGLWGSNLEGVQYDPIVLSQPGQLMYSVHEYGPQMWQGSWFNPHTTYATLSRRWDRIWGYLLTARTLLRAPVFIGEFGTCHEYWACISANQGWKQGFWFQSFVRYLHDHPEASWAYWSLNPDGPFQPGQANFYSLMTPDWKHYFPLVTHGLAPLLAASDGLWHGGPKVPLAVAPLPGCPPAGSCHGPIPLPGVAAKQARAAQPAPVTRVQVETDVSYVGHPDRARQGTLYVPQGRIAGPRPAVLVLHGGTWEAGGRTPEVDALALGLARQGYVTYEISYRLTGDGGAYPNDIVDVKQAAAWLAANAGVYTIDPTHIGAVGAGAGGYLAMMAAYTPNNPPFAPGTSLAVPRFAAVAALFAPVDLPGVTRVSADPAAVNAVSTYLGTSPQGNTGIALQASPKAYVAGAVPTLFIHGDDDTDAPFGQTFHFFRSLKQHVVPAKLVDLPGSPHGLADISIAARAAVLQQITAFFGERFQTPDQG